jgi:F-type H+-transporting ATPase subunit alpha
MVEVLKQGQFKPMHYADQVMIIYAGTKGYLDKVPRAEVSEWEAQFLRFMKEQRKDVRDLMIKEKDKKVAGELETKLKAAIEAFIPQYKSPSAAATTAKPRETNIREGEPPVVAGS